MNWIENFLFQNLEIKFYWNHNKVKHIDTDDVIESEQESSVCDIIENKGESVFRFLEKRCLENSLSQEQLAVISTGGGIVVDSDNRVLIKKKACVIHIKCSIDEIAKRLSSSSRPLLYSTNKKQSYKFIKNIELITFI